MLSEPWLRRASETVESDPGFARVADDFEATIAFGVDGDDVAVAFADGRMEVIGDAGYERWDVALRAPAATWHKLLSETPPPRHHDLVAAWLQADLVVEGDLRLALRHLRPLKRLIASFREVQA
jgi:hypothetical protein